MILEPLLAAQIARRERVLDAVRACIVQNLHVRREADELDPDCPLFATGLGLDSVDAVELVVMLEVEFGLEIKDEVLLRGALRTVNTLVDLILARSPRVAKDGTIQGAS